MVIYAVLTLLLVAYSLKSMFSNVGPTDETNRKGYASPSDTTGDLIDRVERSLVRGTTVNYPSRYMVWGLWVTFLGSFMFTDSLPDAPIFLRNWVVISIILLSLHGYYKWHSDKFSSFTALDALERLRNKLALKKGDMTALSDYQEKIDGADAPWTFTCGDYMLGTRFPTPSK